MDIAGRRVECFKKSLDGDDLLITPAMWAQDCDEESEGNHDTSHVTGDFEERFLTYKSTSARLIKSSADSPSI